MTSFASAAPLQNSATALARFAPSDDRPALGSHLVIRRQVQMSEVHWVVKNPETMKYYSFPDGDWALISLFDGTRSHLEIIDEYNRRSGASIDLAFVLEYDEMLRKFEMLEQRGAQRHLALVEKFKTARKRRAEARAEGFNPFFLLFKVLDPNDFLDRTAKYVRWIWRPTTVAISSIFFLFTIAVFIDHWDPIWTGTIELYSFLKKPFWDVVHFFFILTLIGGIHEFGHAYATKIYGGEVHDIGIALLYFTPAFYCDTTDALLFQNKWHQLWVTVAGIYVEAFICSAATILWVFAYPDSLVHELAYKTMLFTGISTVFFNINPLVKIDGYHALCSVLEMPELREESFRYLGALFQRHILRLNVEVPAASRRRRRIYWIYGTLALVYLGSIMLFIAGLFYNLYAKYFPNAAIVLLVVTLYHLFKKRVRLLVRVSKLFVLDKKELIRAKRGRRNLLAAAAVLLVILGTPWPRRVIQTDAVLRPERTARIEAPSDGTITSVATVEGAFVRAGQPILMLTNPVVDSRVGRVQTERARFAAEARAHRSRAAEAEAYVADRREAAAAGVLSSQKAEQDRLNVRAPISGRVLSQKVEDLVGRFVRSGTQLAEVGDCSTLVADLLISERMLQDVKPGAPVRLQLRAQPWRVIEGRVIRISATTVGGAQTLSSTDLRASDRPERFTAVAVFDNSTGVLRPGMVGEAKIQGPRMSYLAQVWTGFRRWFQARFW